MLINIRKAKHKHVSLKKIKGGELNVAQKAQVTQGERKEVKVKFMQVGKQSF
jgi:hypothetical protein